MKPKPFDGLNHFTFPVGTSVSPMSAFWISPRPSFRREAIGRSLLRSFRGKNTGRLSNGYRNTTESPRRRLHFPGTSFIPITREISVFSPADCTLRSRRPPAEKVLSGLPRPGADPARRPPSIYTPERWFSSTNMGYHGEQRNDIFSASFPLERDADAYAFRA